MKKNVKCPKCKCRRLVFREESIAYTYFEQDSEGNVPAEGYNVHGEITGVNAVCKECKHSWKPRGVFTMLNIEGYDNDKPFAEPVWMNGHGCLGCGLGWYDGYAVGSKKTMPCQKCGHQAPSKMTNAEFRAAIIKRDERIMTES